MNAVSTFQPDALPPSSMLSLSLPEGLAFEEWRDIGRELAAREKVLNWWIGDWWAFGEHRYGDRAQVAAQGIFPLGFQALMDCGSVARAFPGASRRREAVSFSAHREVAHLARHLPDAAVRILDRAERDHLTVAQVRRAVRALQAANDVGETTPPIEATTIPKLETDAFIANSALVEIFERWISGAEPNEVDWGRYHRAKNFVSGARRWDQGDIRPYRPIPTDFREVYLQLGQSPEINEHYRTNWRVIRRWIEEAGGEELRAERRKVSGATSRPALRSGNRARRYVMGRTLSPISDDEKKG